MHSYGYTYWVESDRIVGVGDDTLVIILLNKH